MRKRSIRQWVTLWFTAILLLSLVATAGWNYYWTNRAALEVLENRAGTCSQIIGMLLEEWKLEDLSADGESQLYLRARAMMRSLCQFYRLDYIYVYQIDPETNFRHFILCVAGDEKADQLVLKERNFGAISEDPLDKAELVIMAGSTDLQRHILVNKYGREVTWLMPYRNSDDPLRTIIGMDYSLEMEQRDIIHNFLLDILPMIFALTLGFLCQLILVRRRITNPIHMISDSMNRFARNSSVKPEALLIKTGDEIGEIAASYEKMTDEISSYIANIEALTREKVETNVQLDIARRIQYGLVPEKTALSGNGFSVCAQTHPAKAVGGDFYDFFMRDDKTVCIVMGDVSGKGVSAAILMAMVKTMIREKLLAGLSPARVLNEANDEICPQNPESLFATVFAGILNIDTGLLCYANAGHTHPVLLGVSPSLLIPDAGIALGLFKDAGLKDYTLTLGYREGILLYTDGITEAVNPEKVFFGEERLMEALKEDTADQLNAADTAERVVYQVEKAWKDFYGDGEPFDDAAVLALFCEAPKMDRQPLPVSLSSFDEIKKAVLKTAGDTQKARQVLLACDEVLANIVNYSSAENLAFSCIKENDSLCILFSDDGVPFDLTASKPEEKEFDLLDAGGMGISLIRQIATSVAYERKDGRNELTLRFSLS